MDLVKQYIIQSISAASNNLRLSTQKIEVVSLLRDCILRSTDLEFDIKEMKKITELSKFAIRLHEIYGFLNQPFVDFFKVSEKFKEHSQYLIKDLSTMLENVNPASFNLALNKLHPVPAVGDTAEYKDETSSEISIDFSRRPDSEAFEDKSSEPGKEKPLNGNDNEEAEFFNNYEAEVLRPIKPLDEFLQGLTTENIDRKLVSDFSAKIKHNLELSSKIGFEIIAGMHKIILESLELIDSGLLQPDKHTITSIRACLIVIVAVVKGKEIDITGYLNRAEEFGSKLNNIKKRD